MPTTAWISGLSKSRFEALDDVRDVAAPQLVDERAGVLGDRPEQHGEVRPRQAPRLDVGCVVEREPAHRLDAVADPRRLSRLVVELAGEQVAALPRLVTGAHHRLRQAMAGGDALGDRPAEFDDALARAEVVVERDLPDAVVAVRERDDVRDLAAAPLVDRLVVVADDAQVRAELRQPADESLLQRVDVLVLVDDDVADVVADVVLDDAGASSSSASPSRNWTARLIISV